MQLMGNLSEHFGQDLIFSGMGVARILVFRSKASILLTLGATDEDEDDGAVIKVAKKIVNESKELKQAKFKYRTRINFEDIVADVSPTLLCLLSL